MASKSRSRANAGGAGKGAPKPALRRVFNFRLFVGTLVFLGIAVGGGYAWHDFQVRRMAGGFLEDASAFEKEAEIAQAVADKLLADAGKLDAEGRAAEADDKLRDAQEMRLQRQRKLGEAADFLRRYLQVSPADAETQVRLVEILDQCSTRLPRLVDLYYEAVAKADETAVPRLRRRLAEHLWDLAVLDSSRRLQNLAAAIEEAKKLPNDEQSGRGWGVIAMALCQQQTMKVAARSAPQVWPAGSIGEAFDSPAMGGLMVRAFEQALKLDPRQVDVAMMLAGLYRSKPEAIDAEKLTPAERAQKADRIVDNMVDANSGKPQAATAFLSRYQYRLTLNDLSGAVADLESALRAGPANASVWLAAARSSRRAADDAARSKEPADKVKDKVIKLRDEARARYQRVIQLQPVSPAAYVELGDMLSESGDGEGAFAKWKEGLKQAKPRHELNARLAEALLTRVELDAATKRLADTPSMREELTDAEVYLHALGEDIGFFTDAREKVIWTQTRGLLEARWHVAKGENLQAAELLKEVGAGQHDTPMQLKRCVRAYLLLGDIYARSRSWQLAATTYEQAVEMDPVLVEARLKAAAAWEGAGRLDAAVRHYQHAVSSDPRPLAKYYLALASAEFRRQLGLPKKDRNWDVFDDALDAAEDPENWEPLTEPWKATILEAQYSLALGDAAREPAVKTLRAAEKSYPKSADLLSALVIVYQQLGEKDDADRALAALDKLGGSEDSARLTRAQLLVMRKDWKGAEAALLKALASKPDDFQALTALLRVCVQEKTPAIGREALENFAKNPKFTLSEQELMLAEGYEILGDQQQARAHYSDAARQFDEDEAVQTSLALFLAREGSDKSVEEAIDLLQRFLKRVPNATRYARQTLVRLLLIRGGDEQWREAQRLLKRVGSESLDPGWALRVQALSLFSRRDKDNVEKARQTLERLIADPAERTPLDRLMLARILEEQGNLAAARQQYLELVGVDQPLPAHLAWYADFLLRNNFVPEAGTWIDALKLAAPDALPTVRLRARWLLALDKAADIKTLVEDYEARLSKDAANDKHRKSEVYRVVGDLYVLVKQFAAAEPWYARLAELTADEYGPLAGCLASQQRFKEAIELCVKASKSDDSSRPALILASALLMGQPGREHLAQLRPADTFLSEAIKKHAKDVLLLRAVADLRFAEGLTQEAVDLYRVVLDLRPRDAEVLNNLAALLGEQAEGRSEALRCINQAIEIAGRWPTLLDTKAMILFGDANGKKEEIETACGLLKEASESPHADARHHFHLAVAYSRLAQLDKAKQELAAAWNGGFEAQLLTESDGELLRELLKDPELKKKWDELKKSKPGKPRP